MSNKKTSSEKASSEAAKILQDKNSSGIQKGASHVGISINTHEALWSKKGKDR